MKARAFLLAALALSFAPLAAADELDWRSEWEVADGFALDIDVRGLHLPAAIAMVPNPGPAPDDPLYFVTELRGRVKVVTNDRRVLTFADQIAKYSPEPELPNSAGSYGVAGICLAPEQGYVFATFVYWDETNRLKNAIVRYETRPGRFATKPSAVREERALFANDPSSTSHQIGSCDVAGDSLYVSVGDGYQTALSHSLEATGGKILRLTLDLEGHPDNPFFDPAQPKRPRSLVFAYGFRNPYSLRVVDGRVFTAENGPTVDRFLPVAAGDHHLWDGDNWSIGTNAPLFFAPSIGPAQLAFHPDGGPLGESYQGRFLLASAGVAERKGAGLAGEKSVLAIDYDRATGRVRSVPRQLLRWVGKGNQDVVGVGVGADGVYVTPVMPNGGGESFVLRIHRDGEPHPRSIGGVPDGRTLIQKYACLGCHSYEGRGGAAGPSLDPTVLLPRLAARLSDAAYAAELAQLTGDETQQAARAAVLAAQPDARTRVWLVEHLIDPRFDAPHATMPSLDVTREHAELIAQLLAETPMARPGERKRAQPPTSWRRRLLAFPVGHMLAGLGGVAIGLLAARVLANRTRGGT